MEDSKYMQHCLELASKGKGYTSPNPLVGCVIVRNGEILAEGYHHSFGEKHAEMDALDKIAGKAKGATLYVNLEPCCFSAKTPPCVDRIIKEGISEVAVGVRDPNPKVAGKGIEALEKNGITIREGVLEDECRMLNQFFFKWIKTGLPYITLKIAQTSDGFVAHKDGSPSHITNQKSRTEVHKMRTWYDGVLIGKRTAIIDNPKLTVRHVDGRQPYRIVLGSHDDIENKNLNLLEDDHLNKTIWLAGLDLKSALENLSQKNISSILVEGGPQIWQSFINENFVDQVIIFTSEKKFNEGIPILPNGNFDQLKYIRKEEKSFGTDKMTQLFTKIY